MPLKASEHGPFGRIPGTDKSLKTGSRWFPEGSIKVKDYLSKING